MLGIQKTKKLSYGSIRQVPGSVGGRLSSLGWSGSVRLTGCAWMSIVCAKELYDHILMRNSGGSREKGVNCWDGVSIGV